MVVLGLILALAGLLATSVTSAQAAPVGLGTAGSFAVLGGSGITNTGPTVVSGDLGSCPTPAITGFPPGMVINGTVHAGDAVCLQAQSDLVIAYNDAAGRPPTTVYPGVKDLGGETLLPGVYKADAFAITGTLTLDAQGDPAAVWIFQAGSTLITEPNSRVVLVNGAQACNVFWQVGSSATLGVGSTFIGTILALTSITANTNATVQGRLLARNGALTLDSNTVTNPCTTTPTTSSSSTSSSTSSTTVPPTTTSSTLLPPITLPPITVPPITLPPITVPPDITVPPITLPPITVPPDITVPPITVPPITLPPITVPPITVPPTTTSSSTTIPTATTTTIPSPGPGATTTSTQATTTTQAPGTTTTLGTGSTTTTTDQVPSAATTTVVAGVTTASTGVPLFSPQTGLGVQPLARTGQGLSGPLSLAVASIFLGALLVLAPRRGQAPAMAVAQPAAPVRAGTRGPKPSDLMDALERQLHDADARLKARYRKSWICEEPESEN